MSSLGLELLMVMLKIPTEYLDVVKFFESLQRTSDAYSYVPSDNYIEVVKYANGSITYSFPLDTPVEVIRELTGEAPNRYQ